MDTVTVDFARPDADAEMTVLTPDDFTVINPEAQDEVENLRNSLREVVHDDSVRPKMQCLMMDSSFSMVTMQGEDSGIAWETTPSRCNTPWASEAGNQSVDFNYSTAASSATPGSHPAGKIIFVMDEDLMSRRKKPKERVSMQRSKQGQGEALGESSDNISGRPELVEVSQPNVRSEDIDQEELIESLVDKEQQLFSLVSEGSEILNIMVPPELDTVDEEESKEMVDNLSYLEESPVAKASLERNEKEMPADLGEDDQERSCPPAAPVSDPPGAPVARPPPARGPARNVDYFEAFNLIDAQAPGSPAVVSDGTLEPEVDDVIESQETERPEASKDTSTTMDTDKSDTTSVVEITGELLDEVFYGGTDNYLSKSIDSTEGGGAAKSAPMRHPSKPSGSTLFGSQEEILTPIFLPEGPPKIIDPILLEEPKAMAFLYTDLYEEALGTRKKEKEEDAESLTSEKSFHSRHSDREARGYLEKYVLIDETPVVEVEPADKDKQSDEGPRILTQDLYDFGDFVTQSEKSEMPNSEEEITDFFRSSGNSSPCDIEPFSRTLEDDDTQKPTQSKAKAQKSVSVKVTVPPVDPLSISNFEFPLEEPDWDITDDHPMAMDNKDDSANEKLHKQDSDVSKPIAPPRKKAASALKACLDLTPLTPVDAEIPDQEEVGIKEQREEEKETASPAETADEGDGDGEETIPVSSDVDKTENLSATSLEMEIVQESNEVTVRDVKTEGVSNEAETAEQQTEAQETDVKSGESDKIEKREESSAEAAKSKGQCVIL